MRTHHARRADQHTQRPGVNAPDATPSRRESAPEDERTPVTPPETSPTPRSAPKTGSAFMTRFSTQAGSAATICHKRFKKPNEMINGICAMTDPLASPTAHPIGRLQPGPPPSPSRPQTIAPAVSVSRPVRPPHSSLQPLPRSVAPPSLQSRLPFFPPSAFSAAIPQGPGISLPDMPLQSISTPPRKWAPPRSPPPAHLISCQPPPATLTPPTPTPSTQPRQAAPE